MAAVRSLTKRYDYKKWQLALLSVMFPAAYGAVSLATRVESLAATFFTDIPESSNVLFVILLLFTLFRYGLIGAVAGYLRAGRQRGSLWLATAGGAITGVILFFITNFFLKLPVNGGQLVFVLVESAILAFVSSLIVSWAPRFPFRYTMPIAASLYFFQNGESRDPTKFITAPLSAVTGTGSYLKRRTGRSKSSSTPWTRTTNSRTSWT